MSTLPYLCPPSIGDEIDTNTLPLKEDKNMARKSTSGLATPSEKIAVAVDTTSQGELATDPIPHIKVNNANLAEIKSSLDEAVKGVRSVLQFMVVMQGFTPHRKDGALTSST
jgi:hypothetical protein